MNHRRIYACRKKVKSYTLYICCCRLFLINDLFIYLAHPNFIRFSLHSSTVLYSLGNGSFVLETFIIRIYEFRALLFQSMPSDSSLFCRWYRYCCCLGLKFNNDFCCALLSLLYWQNILLKIHTSGSQLHFDANGIYFHVCLCFLAYARIRSQWVHFNTMRYAYSRIHG